MKNRKENFTTLHWDRILLMNDLLTSDILPNTEFSKFNLLVFEASNWYKVDPKILYRKEHNNFKWGLHK